jgi:hypothetical protein
MSEHLIRLFLNELRVVRIICNGCKTVIETDMAKLESLTAPIKCPGCPAFLGQQTGGQSNPLLTFAQSVSRLGRMKDNFQVEFAIPEPKTA